METIDYGIIDNITKLILHCIWYCIHSLLISTDLRLSSLFIYLPIYSTNKILNERVLHAILHSFNSADILISTYICRHALYFFNFKKRISWINLKIKKSFTMFLVSKLTLVKFVMQRQGSRMASGGRYRPFASMNQSCSVYT